MLILYLDTTSGRWYNCNGAETESPFPKIAFQSREELCIITVTGTPDTMPLPEDPLSWPRDTQWGAYLAKITVDNDYIHKIKCNLVDDVDGYVESINVRIANANAILIPNSGVVRLFSDDGSCESIAYTQRYIDGDNVNFVVSGNLEKHYASGSDADCPQAPYFEAPLNIEKSDPANGEFVFDLIADSVRLRDAMMYNSNATLQIQGLELLFYRSTETGNEVARAFICKTFAVVATLGDVDASLQIPDGAIDHAHEIIASIVSNGVDVQLSVNGEQWLDYPATEISGSATLWRFRYKSVSGEWSPAIPLLAGKDGRSAYDVAVLSGFNGNVDEWLRSLVGPVGESAYETAVNNGFDGNVEEWLQSLVGPAGEGLNYDASGASATDRALYDNKPAGFKFATADVDNEKRVTNMQIFTKLSDAFADWSPALSVSFFGNLVPDIISTKPIEFTPPPENGVYYLAIDISGNPDATVANVCIYTDEGEMVLPYYSDLGVRKIIKNNDILYIYFGNAVPPYEAGRVYLTQMIAASKSEDSSSEIIGGTMHYGYIPSSSDFQSVKDITADLLNTGTMTAVDADAIGAVNLGTVPAGTFTVVLIPATSKLIAKKDDGFGGKVNFDLNNGVAGSGANGASVFIGVLEYRVYGEFNLVSGETIVYID